MQHWRPRGGNTPHLSHPVYIPAIAVTFQCELRGAINLNYARAEHFGKIWKDCWLPRPELTAEHVQAWCRNCWAPSLILYVMKCFSNAGFVFACTAWYQMTNWKNTSLLLLLAPLFYYNRETKDKTNENNRAKYASKSAIKADVWMTHTHTI